LIISLGTPRREPVTAHKINSTAYIAGGVTAFVGLIVVTAAVAVLVRRQRKVCYHTKHARFPYPTNQHVSSTHVRARTFYSTAFNQSPTPSPSSKPEKNCSPGNARRKEENIISRQFMTDGHEKTVRFNYEVTWHPNESGNQGKDEHENNDVFMI